VPRREARHAARAEDGVAESDSSGGEVMEPCEATTARDGDGLSARAEDSRGAGATRVAVRVAADAAAYIVNIRSSSAGSEGSRARQTGRRGSRLGVAAAAYTAAAQLSSSRGFGDVAVDVPRGADMRHGMTVIKGAQIDARRAARARPRCRARERRGRWDAPRRCGQQQRERRRCRDSSARFWARGMVRSR
jgi:hypothetical protein